MHHIGRTKETPRKHKESTKEAQAVMALEFSTKFSQAVGFSQQVYMK